MSHGRCTICKAELMSDWHADHIHPYSKGGATELHNGQALCPECNLRKGANIQVKLRQWQNDFYKDVSARFYGKKAKTYMLHAGVGSGKTIAATYFAATLIKQGYNVFICSPSSNVKDSWAREFNNFDIDISNDYNYSFDFRRHYQGVSTTYQAMMNNNNLNFLISNNIVNDRTVLILDEVHHLADNNQAWGNNIKTLGDSCRFVLLLTGTPTRSDDKMIPFAKYEAEHKENEYRLQVDFSYSYSDSVIDRICCPISFRAVDIITDGINGYLPGDHPDRVRIMKNALTVTPDNKFVMSMYESANAALDKLRNVKPNAAGLIVSDSIADAIELGKLIPDSVVVTSRYSTSDDIEEFAKSNKKWIISVQMVSEGVNIPRLRVLVYAHSFTTSLFFQQVAGRGVRNRKDEPTNPIDHCYIYYPNHEPYVKNAREIEDEISHIVELQILDNDWPPTGPGGGGDDIWCDGPIDYMLVEAGDISHINGGIHIPTLLKGIEPKVAANEYHQIERMFAELSKSKISTDRRVSNQEISNAPKKLKTEVLKDLRKRIHDIINSAVYRLNGSPSEKDSERKRIHAELNLMAGMSSQQKEHNEEKLMLKLELAKKHYGNEH